MIVRLIKLNQTYVLRVIKGKSCDPKQCSDKNNYYQTPLNLNIKNLGTLEKFNENYLKSVVLKAMKQKKQNAENINKIMKIKLHKQSINLEEQLHYLPKNFKKLQKNTKNVRYTFLE